MSTCILPGCAKDAYCRDLCPTHYTRWRRQGKPGPLAEWAASGGHLMRPCVECGTPCHANRGKQTCSEVCSRQRQQRRWRENYHALPPEKKQAALERNKQRRQDNPEWAKEQDCRKQERLQTDPEQRAKRREVARDWYARNAERVQAKRQAKLAGRLERMSDAELAEYVERQRRYTREWRRRLRSNPERFARDQAYQEELRRRRKAATLANDVAALERLLAGRANASKVKPCIICGQPVVGKHASAKVCSAECRRKRTLQLLYPPRPRACLVCGKVFDARTSAKICSEECRRARKAGVSLEQLPQVARLQESAVCEVCGKTYQPWRARQRGCSPDCMAAGNYRRKLEGGRKGPYEPRPCVVCGKDYEPMKRNQGTCGTDCRAEYHRRTEKQRGQTKRRNHEQES